MLKMLKLDIVMVAIVVALIATLFLSSGADDSRSAKELNICARMCEVHKTDVRTFESGTCVCK